MAKSLARIIQAGIKQFQPEPQAFDGMEVLGEMCIQLKGRKGFILDSVDDFNYRAELRQIPGCMDDNGQFSGVYIDINAKKIHKQFAQATEQIN